jgi:hypothetical protein
LELKELADDSQNEISGHDFQIYSDNRGKIFLLWHSSHMEIQLARPITSEKLDRAKSALLTVDRRSLRTRANFLQTSISPERKEANQEIERTLHPIRKGTLFSRANYMATIIKREAGFWFVFAALLTLPYKGIQYSGAHFPPTLHLAALLVYVIVLITCIRMIATEENRGRFRDQIHEWFGPRGLLVLPCLILITAAAVFASLTFRLYSDGRILLETCQGRPVSEAGLLDFYVWHFFRLIPLLKLNEVLKWNEPFCYSQGRVGFLILLFQALVVLPAIGTLRYYWRTRWRLSAGSKYAFDPLWQPAGPHTLLRIDRS